MVFKNWLNRDRVVIETNPGSPIVELFHGVIGEDGELELVSDGKTSLYAEIQSHKESCDINVIIQRFKNGDVSVLNKRQPQYFDATEMPKTMAEALNMVHQAEYDFDHLPADVKEKFGNDYRKYIVTAGSSDWYSALGFVPEKSAAKSSLESSSESSDVKEVSVDE